ncbi:MAG TPA: M28 family peptidase [Thermoleophilaceae bacterium]|jgi:aminopeptidase YwaD
MTASATPLPRLRRLAAVAAVVSTGLAGGSAPAPAGATVAMDEMSACSRLGPKPPGSTAGRSMSARIAERFRAAGLETTLEDFHVPVFVVRKVSLDVLGPNARRVPGESFAYGGTGRVEADVVDVGVGRASDYAGRDAEGRIVMVRRDEAYHRSSQLTEVLAHGGVAMLYVSGSPDNLVQTGAVRFAQTPPAPIPTITVGADDGAQLRSELESGGLRMAIEVDAQRQDGVGRNVIGVRRGTTRPDDVIVVGGHYDNWHMGAIDDCTGVGSMLAMARALKDVPLDYTVLFGAWDAEEIGLVGSYDWVMRHPDVLRRVAVNENLEMTAANDGALSLRFGTESPTMNAVANGAATANSYYAAPVPAAGVRQISGGIIPTDLQPFYSAGVQGFSTFTSTPWYHTRQDLPERVDEAPLERVTSYLRDTLLGLQSAPPESLRAREVPTVTVDAPKTAAPGAELPVEVRVSGTAGEPVTGVQVKVLTNQRDHWAVDEGLAEEVGGGVYRYRVRPGATEADRTSITATVNRPEYIAEGYAFVDQRAGGVLPPAPGACAKGRFVRIALRAPRRSGRILRVRAKASAGRMRLVTRRRVVVDLRGVRRRALRVYVSARTSSGRLVKQRRSYPVCATTVSVRRAVGGMG